MPSVIDQIASFQAANPTAKFYVYELLIRGKASADSKQAWGQVQGSHFSVGMDTVDPLGKTQTQILGPFPISLVPGDAEAVKFIGAASVAAQATIEAHAATIDEQAKALAERDKSLKEKAATIDEQEKAIKEKQAQLDALTKVDAAAVAEPADKSP